MIDATFVINDQDFAPITATYRVVHVPEVAAEVKTFDGRIHRIGKKTRTNIIFSLYPNSDLEREDDRVLRESPLVVLFTDREFGTERKMEFDVVSGTSSAYGIKSITGANYYAGEEITLEALEVDNARNFEHI